MKKIFTKLFVIGMILITTSMNVSAQEVQEKVDEQKETETYNALEQRHEFRLGVGFFSTVTNFSMASMYPSFVDTRTVNEFLLLGFTGILPRFDVNYTYRACKSFAIGVFLSSDFEWFHNAGINMDFYYINKPKFAMYGNLGLGAVLCTGEDVDNQIFPTFGIYPIGLKFGNKIGGFVEAGYGYKGIFNVGGYVKF